ncbi:MAG: FtsW/RodA/SpoVE family cell cycle protein [Acidimicrobiales bacterium]|nr:FtsW/RodA/SpoVE family cell cycle protein [Acidimicrobiales bacterium]
MIGAHRRTTELGLIVLAVIVVGAAYTLASLGTEASIPANVVPFLLVIFGLLIGAHIAVRKLAPLADGILLPLAALLNGLGYVWIARLDKDLAALQATWTALGILGFVLTLLFVRRMRDLDTPYTLMVVGVGLLLLPLVPGVGRTINGARIWVALGPVSFQPGEFAKIALAISFAAYLVRKREVLSMATFKIGPFAFPEPRDLGPVMLAWGFSLLVMFFEKDLGSSLLFFALFITMVWIATQRATYLVLGTILFSAGAFFAWRTFDHVQTRVTIWLNPWDDPADKGFQVIQGWFSLAAGGVTGKGPGLGQPGLIPAADTDFIFAAIGEELGLLGGSLILVAFVLMVGAGLRIALTTDREFDKLLAAGLTTLLGIQAFIIIGGVTRLLPLTGVTLPFISYGGSSLVANYVLLALLLRISDDSTRRINEGAAA